MACFQKFGSKKYLVMEVPQKIGICHSCLEDVDTWDRVIEIALWTGWEAGRYYFLQQEVQAGIY